VIDDELDVAGVLDALLVVARSPARSSASILSKSSTFSCLPFFFCFGILRQVLLRAVDIVVKG
jgi:hypothetical protein